MNIQKRYKTLYSLRKTPSQGRSKATVDAILTAAARILISSGYAKASTNRIAEVAGVSIGSLYEYFPGKEAIFAEVRRREDQRLFELMMSEPQPKSVEDMIRSTISVYLEFVQSNLDLHNALINEVPQFAVGQLELPIYKDYLPWLTEFLHSHNAELRVNRSDQRAAQFLIFATRSTIDNYVLHIPGNLNDSMVKEMLIDMVRRFLLP
ncbi:MAG: TetR/AcrR family transcriptional regulator [Parasphingorhabdus sp.]